MNIKKRFLLLVAAFAAGTAGCGTTAADIEAQDGATQTLEASMHASKAREEAPEEEGTVLLIQCWDEEFRQLLENYYPGYEKVDENTGKIGDVTVKFTITPLDGNEYQNHLDSVLPENQHASEENTVDLFLVDAEDAAKYTDADTGFAMRLSDLGITDEELSEQYAYTKEVTADANGDLRGASWQAFSGGMIYNRKVALEALGYDDPDKVQEAVRDWDAFQKTADAVKAAGYHVTATVNDTYRVYAGGVSHSWVEDGNLSVDDTILRWAEDSGKMLEKEETTSAELWSETWNEGMDAASPVFAYFGPGWLLDTILDDAESLGSDEGTFGIVEGPQSFFWGGTWICAAQGTDNPTLVKDIILTMTADAAVMEEIAENESECVNNRKVLTTLSLDDAFDNAALGGQNPYEIWALSAEKINADCLSVYDSTCSEAFRSAMESCFDGSRTYEEALEIFEQAVAELYPEITEKTPAGQQGGR